MKLQVLLAAGALILLSAAPSPQGTSELDSVVGADHPHKAAPPKAEAAPRAHAPAPAAKPAPVAPAAYASKYYPPCTAQRTDRCRQGVRARAYRPDRREMRLAMRAGERG